MKSKRYRLTRVFIYVFLFISVVCPLVALLLNINPSDISTIVSEPNFGSMVFNSVFASSVATIISVLIALSLAWAINRSNIKHKSVFTLLFTLPMLIPSISHGMGLVILFGDNGIITNFLGLNINLYGFTGIIIGSVLYSFPVAFLMLSDIFRYEDYTVYEASQVLGLTKWQQFKSITLPNLRKPLISVVFAVFTMVFTDYGVPLVVGGRLMTLPVYMYREVIGLLNFSKGAIIGVLLLIPAVIAFIIDLKDDSTSTSSTVTRAYEIKENKKRDRISLIYCLIIMGLIALPIIAFIVLSLVSKYPIDMSLSFANIARSFDLGVGHYLLNSLTIALVTALVGTFVSYITAYITARSKKNFSTLCLHLISILSLAIPGVVLGLSYVLFFKGSIIYGSIIILIMVNLIHFLASPYLLAYNSLSSFNSNLEDVAVSVGISKWRLMIDVFMPCTLSTMVEMYSYIFVNSMITISAVSFLANFKNMPLALMIPQFEAQSMIEATAFISIIILVFNLITKFIVYLVKRYLIKEV